MCSLQSQIVAVRPKSTNHTDSLVGEIGMVAERFTSVHVRQMQLNKRHLSSTERIAKGDAGVRESAGIDQNKGGAVGSGLVDAIDQFAFMIALQTIQRVSQSLRLLTQMLLNISQPGVAVDGRLASTKQVEVGAIEQEQLCHGEFELPRCRKNIRERARKYRGYWR